MRRLISTIVVLVILAAPAVALQHILFEHAHGEVPPPGRTEFHSVDSENELFCASAALGVPDLAPAGRTRPLLSVVRPHVFSFRALLERAAISVRNKSPPVV